ncbi:ferritin-like domain-containing protein [Marinilabilia sp.]|uniref:ferritin-like domain-containing protein n=1 Tax=Marinilabilia sp. TaxID=2021252 RepID=UPI0025C5704D|nr:ferritin-like domain-containing protein [Marinilabilia sp.]
MSNYHEPAEELSQEARNFSRALNSLKEEVEAVDWYHQRVDLTDDESLKKIMAHNRDEEIEHACMTIEWLRRNMPGWDDELRTYLFTEGDVTELEDGEEESDEGGSDSLRIGKIEK